MLLRFSLALGLSLSIIPLVYATPTSHAGAANESSSEAASEASQASPVSEGLSDDGGAKRKKILDLVRLGVVMIETKTYASTESERQSAGAGSGFIVDKKNGLMATNRHVIGDMTVTTYTVKFSNGTRVPAQLVYFDPLYDFAFIKVDPAKLPKDAVDLELSDKMPQVNESIYCMGNSGLDEFSTFRGVVFSTTENLGPFAEQSFRFSGLTIPGASGSPAFNEDGKVIGIVYGGKMSSGAGLPIRYVSDALTFIKDKKMPERRTIGIVPAYVSLEDMTKAELLPVEAMQTYLNEFPQANNKILMINSRMAGSDARTAFQPGDLLWSVNKKLVGPNLYELDRVVNGASDKDVSIEVYRGGKLTEVKVKSQALTLDYARNIVTFMDSAWISNNDFMRLFLGHAEEGVFVLGFGPTSPFRGVIGQLPPFFMDTRILKILEIDGKPLKNLQDLIAVIPTVSHKREIKIKYIDFMGMIGLGQFAPADRQERLAVLTYESKFDSPKFFKFDAGAYEWQATDIAIKVGDKASLMPTTKPNEGMMTHAPSGMTTKKAS